MTTDQLLADRVRLAGVISYLDVMPMDVYSLNHVLMSANFTDSPTQLRSGPHNVTAVRQNGSVVFQTATVNASITVRDTHTLGRGAPWLVAQVQGMRPVLPRTQGSCLQHHRRLQTASWVCACCYHVLLHTWEAWKLMRCVCLAGC